MKQMIINLVLQPGTLLVYVGPTYALIRTVDCYTDRGSHVFACFIDFSKAFDKVNYWKLFLKLLDDKCSVNVVKLLAYWYSHHSSGSVC